MIRVLGGWREVGESILGLQVKGLPLHKTPQKNWDHWLLYTAVVGLDRNSAIVDLGCGEGYTLSLLAALGFTDLRGIDYQIGWRLRARRLLAMWRSRSLRPPYRLFRGNLTATPFAPAVLDLAVSISTIEHGVDLHAFLAEAARLLRPGGLLFVTADYWADKVAVPEPVRVFGLPWRVFCRDEIEQFIAAAANRGLVLVEDGEVPPCAEKKIVFWQGLFYTFLAILFRKA